MVPDLKGLEPLPLTVVVLVVVVLNRCGGGAIRPLPRDGGVEELHGGPTVGPRPQGLYQRSKTEVVPEMVRCRGSDAGQSTKMLVRSWRGFRTRCRGCLSVVVFVNAAFLIGNKNTIYTHICAQNEGQTQVSIELETLLSMHYRYDALNKI